MMDVMCVYVDRQREEITVPDGSSCGFGGLDKSQMGATTFMKCQQNNQSTVGVQSLKALMDPDIQLRERTFIKSIMDSVKKKNMTS